MAQQTSKEFFEELKDWSQRKHQILDMYLSSASKILGSTWSMVYYIDGFAGRGTYGEGTTFSKGSPLKAAEKAQEYRTQGKRYSLRCINVEKDDEHFAQLQAVTASFGDLVTNLSGSFVDNVKRILQIVQDQAV